VDPLRSCHQPNRWKKMTAFLVSDRQIASVPNRAAFWRANRGTFVGSSAYEADKSGGQVMAADLAPALPRV